MIQKNERGRQVGPVHPHATRLARQFGHTPCVQARTRLPLTTDEQQAPAPGWIYYWFVSNLPSYLHTLLLMPLPAGNVTHAPPRAPHRPASAPAWPPSTSGSGRSRTGACGWA